MTELALKVENLSVGFELDGGQVLAVNDVSFDLRRRETLAIVGESGSGKSVTARAIMQIARPGRILSGAIRYFSPDGPVDIAQLDEKSAEIRAIRGNRIAMVFQEPMSSLSPVHRVGDQIVEAITLHQPVGRDEARRQAIEMLGRVHLPDPAQTIDKYTFELSGGQRQRVMIAMALSCNPDILIADEPTTALDVTTQAEILRLIKELQAEFGMSVIFITHDMGVVAEISDRVAVMYRGRLIEQGDVEQIFTAPHADYTAQLVESSSKFRIKGDHARGGKLPSPGAETILEGHDINLTYRSTSGFIRKKVKELHALRDVSFDLRNGENLGIVGESGSGKTTLVKALLGLQAAHDGEAVYRSRDGREVNLLGQDALRRNRLNTEIRMVFQDPFSSLNPRMTIAQIIEEPLLLEGRLDARERRERTEYLLNKVGLPANIIGRYPHAFSGGQRQRISIARALSVQPRLIVADEATSALDGSVRSQVLDLMFELQAEFDLSYIFVGHDLGVVRYFCDRIAVMRLGEIVETGTARQICEDPQHPYTRSLIAAVPGASPAERRLFPRVA
ncbi:MAG: ABC transporter ATP-binding protein [Geminicoccaceae bacterium]|nr:ABC transporter ATP-binding protein [Geminicoccaceae bacterium]MCB9944045.1 ABC transporter ATP-binding protein [Geminicoccaceae bacterium]